LTVGFSSLDRIFPESPRIGLSCFCISGSFISYKN
jgi:hypothetical protein